MRSLLASIALLVPSLAHADSVQPSTTDSIPETTVAAKRRLGVAVNPPFGWFAEDEKSVAGSFYVALDENQVLRGNVARYAYGAPLAIQLAVEIESTFDGSVTDLGASYMYFPRKAYDGFVLEAGLLFRNTDGVDNGEFDRIEDQSMYFAGRGLIGWSWLFGDKVFTSVQIGASVGYKRGTNTTTDLDFGDEGMSVTTRVREPSIAPEAFMRIGVLFDM